MKTQNFFVFALIVIALIVGGSTYYLFEKNKVPDITVSNIGIVNNVRVEPTISKCGFTVSSPLANAEVTFPVAVSGIVDATNYKKDGCAWKRFEGQAGIAQLYYLGQNNTWNKIGNATPIKVVDRTATTTKFSIKLDFNNSGIGLSNGQKLKIVFTEEDASGLGKTNTVELPVTYKSKI